MNRTPSLIVSTLCRTTVFFAATAAASVASAETLARYELVAASTAATSSFTGVTATNVLVGAAAQSGVFGLSSAGDGSAYSRLRTSTSGSAKLATSLAGAITAGSYFEFSLAATEGGVLNLNSLSVDLFAQTISGSSSVVPDYTVNYTLQAIIGTETLTVDTKSYTASAPELAAGTGRTFARELATYDLSDESFQNVGTSIVFRIYLHVPVGTSTSYYQTGRLDNFAVDGALSTIPEPAGIAAVMGGIGGLCVLMRRRRQTR